MGYWLRSRVGFFHIYITLFDFCSTKSHCCKIKSWVNISFLFRYFFFVFFFFFSQPYGDQFFNGFTKTWFFFVSWYNYYDFFTLPIITDLNLLKEIYFNNNSLEFFIINFVLFYGILASILTTFLIKRIFSSLTFAQFFSYKLLQHTNATYFIRNQDFLKQQLTSAGTRVWEKKKFPTL